MGTKYSMTIFDEDNQAYDAEIIIDQDENFSQDEIVQSSEIKKLLYEIKQKQLIEHIKLQEEFRLYCQNQQCLQYITRCHNIFIQSALNNNIQFWRSNNIIYYAIGQYGNKQKLENKDKIFSSLGLDFEILKNTEQQVSIFNPNILISSYLPDVKKEIFCPNDSNEWIRCKDGSFYRNIFKPTSHIIKRHQSQIVPQTTQYGYQNGQYGYQNGQYQTPLMPQTVHHPMQQPIPPLLSIKNYFQTPLHIYAPYDSFIVKFLRSMLKVENDFLIIFDWLQNYFKTFQSKRYVIVLIGDKRTTGYFIDYIIKPIFIQEEQYFCKVDDNYLSKYESDILQENKLFYYLEYNNDKKSTSKDKNLSEAIITVLEKQQNRDVENFTSTEIIVSAEKDNPYNALKDSYKKCLVFNVRNLNAILSELNIERSFLAEEITKDLDNFTNKLCIEKSYFKSYNCEKLNLLPNIQKGIFLTKELDNAIGNFIRAIKNNHIWYFNKLKEKEPELYNELENDLREKKIAQPLLGKYFDWFYGDIIFEEENSYFLEILKDKDDIFKQKLTDESKKGSMGNRKRYDLTYIENN